MQGRGKKGLRKHAPAPDNSRMNRRERLRARCRTAGLTGLMGMWLMGAAVAGHAQAAGPSAVLNLDMRAFAPAGGAAGTELHIASLRVTADAAPGVHLTLYGSRAEGAFAVQEASVEKEWGGTAGSARAGLVRLPFGIYDPRETYASGLIDYPLPRGDYYNDSLDWGAPGASWTGGPPRLQIEAAGFGGLGTGIWNNQAHIRGGAARAQTYYGNAIFGLSRWDGALQDDPASSALRPVHMTGLDARYTRTQLVMRGEYFGGTLAGAHLRGWYVDTLYRLPQQMRWSLVGRVEALKPQRDAPEARQVTLGARYVASPEWTLCLNWRRNSGITYAPIWTAPTQKGGDVFLQAYRRLKW